MADEGPLRFGVVCEARADQETAGLLADRVLLSGVDWLEEDHLPHVRTWCGMDATASFLAWKDMRAEADRLGIRAHGFFSGDPAASDARAARRALLVLRASDPPVEAALLIRDSDGDLDRRRGLEQARDANPWPFAVVIGVAHTKRECWLIAAFEPREEQVQRIAALRQELGFNLCDESHRLTAQDEQAKRSAKRIWAALRPQDEHEHLRVISLESLRRRGTGNGLADYIAQLETRLVPLFTGRKPSGRS